jgi:hypothetical protein
MREYEIPHQAGANEGLVLLLAVDDPALRRSLLKEIYRYWPSAQVEVVETIMALGFALGQTQPRAVILDAEGRETELEALCTHIRECTAPRVVRLGICGEAAVPITPGVRPDILLPPAASAAEIGTFLQGLVGAEVIETRKSA